MDRQKGRWGGAVREGEKGGERTEREMREKGRERQE